METSNNKEFMLEFIETYRQLPALWDSRTKEYNNRNEKDKQYEILLQKYRERYPKANKAQMARHINSLRTSFHRETRRVEQLTRNGALNVKPNGWFYNALSFIQEVTQSGRMHFKGRGCEKQENEATPAHQILLEREIADDECCNQPKPYKQSRKRRAAAAKIEFNYEAAPPAHKQKKHIASVDGETNRLAVKAQRVPFDYFQQISDLWAVKLRKMEPLQQILAEKFINDIMLEGQLGTLHRHSMQLNVKRNLSSASPSSLEYSFMQMPTSNAAANNNIAFETVKLEECSSHSASDST